jgi:predicted transcriptional regulator
MAGKPSSPIRPIYLIDTDNAIIVDVEATTAIRQAEVLAADRTIERAMGRSDDVFDC